MEDVHRAEPASFDTLHVYKPASPMPAFLTCSRRVLFLNVISQLAVGCISILFLYHATVIGWEPATRPSSLKEFPSVSSTVSESFLVKLGGMRRSARNGNGIWNGSHLKWKQVIDRRLFRKMKSYFTLEVNANWLNAVNQCPFLNISASFHKLILNCPVIYGINDKNNLWPFIEPHSCKKRKRGGWS